MGLRPREEMPRRLETLESALITFLPDGYEDDDTQYYYQSLRPEDRDFIDYWWRLLHRFLREEHVQEGAMEDLSQQGEVAPTQIADYSLAEEEKKLMQYFDDREKRLADRVAEEEYASLRDSQAEDEALDARAMSQDSAARYRDWEEWELQRAMELSAPKFRRDDVRIVVRGYVDEVQAQSMQWTVRAHQNVCLRMTLEMPQSPAMMSQGVNTAFGHLPPVCATNGGPEEERGELLPPGDGVPGAQGAGLPGGDGGCGDPDYAVPCGQGHAPGFSEAAECLQQGLDQGRGQGRGLCEAEGRRECGQLRKRSRVEGRHGGERGPGTVGEPLLQQGDGRGSHAGVDCETGLPGVAASSLSSLSTGELKGM